MKKLCNMCPRKCNIDRSETLGFCGSNNHIKIAKVMLHYWEEPIISGDKNTKKIGSGAIFFSNCNMKCKYCQNFEISQGHLGKEIETLTLINIFKQIEEANATNINLVTPTHYSDQIIEALKIYKPKIPIVWNTSGYEEPLQIKKLLGLVDVFLVDFKYYSDDIAIQYSNASSYFEECTQSLFEMRKIVPKDIITDGIMQKGIIVRHLVLPQSYTDSIKIFDWIAENLGTNTYISLMSQYTPTKEVSCDKILSKKVKPLEYKLVLSHIRKLGFENGFIQDNDSASTEFIPEFKKNDNFFAF